MITMSADSCVVCRIVSFAMTLSVLEDYFQMFMYFVLCICQYCSQFVCHCVINIRQ